MIRITDNHGPRLARLSPARVRAALADQLQDHAHAIAEDAVHSILDGAIQGAGHIPSAPYEAPNADTGDLHESIHTAEVAETPDEIRTAVIADSDHAWIERGGANMAPRPYMQPAVERQRGSTVRGLRGAFARTVRGV